MTEVSVLMTAMIANLVSIQDMISIWDMIPIAVIISIQGINVAEVVSVVAWSVGAIRHLCGLLGFIHGAVTGKILFAVILRLFTMIASGRAGMVCFLFTAGRDGRVFGMRIASGCVVLARMTVSILF